MERGSLQPDHCASGPLRNRQVRLRPARWILRPPGSSGDWENPRMNDDRLVIHGSFTSSSSYKPMLFLALSGLPFSFRTVNLKNGVQTLPPPLAINRYGQLPGLQHRGLQLSIAHLLLASLARTPGNLHPQ